MKCLPFVLFIGAILMLNLISAGQYSDCGVYGNCKSTAIGTGGDTYTNATYQKIVMF